MSDNDMNLYILTIFYYLPNPAGFAFSFNF